MFNRYFKNINFIIIKQFDKKKLSRNYYGIEKEKSYFKAAEQRLKNTKPI